MSILQIVQCDQCQTTWPEMKLPGNWFVLSHEGEQRHYCSYRCFFERWGADITKPVEPQEQPACKARRFLLVDENANIVEGVKWEGGRVTLDPERDNTGIRYYFSWDRFKESYPGSGVQWIDQEVAE